MDPEILKYLLNWGFPAVLIGYGLWFFKTEAWPKFVTHLDKLHEMIDVFTAAKEVNHKTFETVSRIDGNVEELLHRIPQRDSQRTHDRESA